MGMFPVSVACRLTVLVMTLVHTEPKGTEELRKEALGEGRLADQ